MMRKLAAGVVVCMVWSNTAFAEMVVIVHKSNPVTSVSVDTLTKYYKKTVELWDSGAEVDPVDLPDDNPLAVEFTDTVLELTIGVKNSMWSIRTSSGLGTPPRQLPDEAAVVSYVASTRGAIGYVDRAQADDSVKIVDVAF